MEAINTCQSSVLLRGIQAESAMILWTIRGGQVSLRLNFNDHIVLEGNLRSHSLWVSAKKFSAELSAKEIVTRVYAVSPVHAGPFQTLLTKTLLKMIYCFTPFYSNFEMSEMRIVSVRPDYVKLAGSPCFKSQSAYLTPQETSNIYANRGSIASGKKIDIQNVIFGCLSIWSS